MSDSASIATDATPALSTDSGVTSSDYSGTSVPLVLISSYRDEQQRHKTEKLPNLPSHRFRYSVWHDLSHTSLTGNELHAPRIRDGPEEKEMLFYKMRDETNRRIHHTRRGRERKDYRDKTENWENTQRANLSYQELQHTYQKENFLRVLRRLMRVEELMLIEDTLVDKLPKIPMIKHLILSENYIKDLKGLEALKKTQIEALELKHNPVAFSLNYRQRVFAVLPQLKYLDGITHQEEDDVVEKEPEGDWDRADDEKSSCIIS